MKGKQEPLLQGVEENFTFFRESIKCIYETYQYTQKDLVKQLEETSKAYEDYINNDKVVVENDRIANNNREYNRLKKRKERAERALELIPSSYIVSLVAMFDIFIAGLVRCVYSINPKLLKDSDRMFTFLELEEFDSISSVQQVIIDEKIDALLRDSHIKQFDWLAKAFGINTLQKFEEWGDFIELTERRNLFVHSNGIVSKQYLKICSKYSALDVNIKEGDKLSVDDDYFAKSYNVLYVVAFMLSQTLLNAVYLKKYAGTESGIDKFFINQVFELICDSNFKVAIRMSEFVLQPVFRHKAWDKAFIALNLAQAYKWKGDEQKCLHTLQNEDWTAASNDLCVPKLVLEEKYDEVYILMKDIGMRSHILTINNYREWPIFKKIREEKEFAEVFREIFGEDLNSVPLSECLETALQGRDLSEISSD